MSKEKWSDDALVVTFKHLVRRFGTWHSNWRPGISSNDYINFFDDLTKNQKYMSIFGNKPPVPHKSTTSPGSPIHTQVNWTLTTQVNMDDGQRVNVHRNRIAAYKAGFLTMHDILELETIRRVNIINSP